MNVQPRITFARWRELMERDLQQEEKTDHGAARLGRWLVRLDLQITRRKRFHDVQNPAGQTVFMHNLAGLCFHWLEAEGIEEYLIETPRRVYSVKVLREKAKKD